MLLSDDLDFPIWIYVMLLVTIPFALLLNKVGLKYIVRMSQHDASARRLGWIVVGFGLALGFAMAGMPYLQMLRHDAKVLIVMGAVGFPMVFVVGGLIYIIAGKKVRFYLSVGLSLGECSLLHVAISLLVVSIAVVVEIIFESHVASLGYHVIGAFR